MIVAITGATGFIGKKLALRHLGRGDEVRVFSRRASNDSGLPDSVLWYAGDLTSSENMFEFVDGVDVLYHCAGEIRDPARMEAVHVHGTGKLLDAAAGKIDHWVQLSSVGVYGPVHDGIIDEGSPIKPVGEYETTKAESDRLVIEKAAKGGFSYSILRPSNVFAAEMTNRSLFQMVSMIEKGLYFYIGKPGASANYIHVDNVAEGLVRCGSMDDARGKIFNLSDHRTLEHAIEVIAETLGRPSPRLRIPYKVAQLVGATFGKLPGFPLTLSRVDALTNRSIYANARIERELGYRHVITMEEGLQELTRAYIRRERP